MCHLQARIVYDPVNKRDRERETERERDRQTDRDNTKTMMIKSNNESFTDTMVYVIPGVISVEVIIIINRFYIALFSALEQTHCAQVDRILNCV